MNTLYGALIERDGAWHVGMVSHAMIAAVCLGDAIAEDRCRGYEWDEKRGLVVQANHTPWEATAGTLRAEEEANAFLRTAKGKRAAAENLVAGALKTKDPYHIHRALYNAKLTAKQRDRLVGALIGTKDAHSIYNALCDVKLTAKQRARLVGALIGTKDADYIHHVLCVAKLTSEQRDRLVDALAKTKDAHSIYLALRDAKLTAEQRARLKKAAEGGAS